MTYQIHDRSKKIQVAVLGPGGQHQRLEIDARPVTFEGVQGDFCAHHSVRRPELWVITETVSGRRVDGLKVAFSIDEACQVAGKTLRAMPAGMLDQKIRSSGPVSALPPFADIGGVLELAIGARQ